VQAQLWGVEFGACLGAVLPFGPENTMNYTVALGARAAASAAQRLT
jgi:hypothetical protein